MHQEVFIQLAAILVLGILAQWISWKIHLPSILVLLLTGFLVGPVLNWIDPDKLFGVALFPIVSLSVAIILFEGGLSLSYRQLKNLKDVVLRLVTIGVALTFGLVALTAHYVLNMNWHIAALFGSILVVTGPTVIIPLLHHLRVKREIGQVILWEGIVNDPIGATMALIAFEVIIAESLGQAILVSVLGIFKTLLIGTLLGALGAFLLVFLMKRYWLPEFLHNPVTLMVLIIIFGLSNHFQEESGLLAVTLMGIFMANQKMAPVKHILEFKENLRLILIAVLFILLSARLELSVIPFTDPTAYFFLFLLIFVIRPVMVSLSTIGTSLNWRERVLLFWMAPRGIVAAAVSSIFGLYLVEKGMPEGMQLMSYTFFVIVGTVAFYGLTAGRVASLLKLSFAHPQGILIVGAHAWGRKLARFFKGQGIDVLLVDSNKHNVKMAEREGCEAQEGNILLENFQEGLDLSGIGKLFALTSNDEVNTLACLHFADLLGRENIFQIAYHEPQLNGEPDRNPMWRGRILFDKELTFEKLESLLKNGGELKVFKIDEHYTFDDFLQQEDRKYPLILKKVNGKLEVWAEDKMPEPEIGDQILAIVLPVKNGQMENGKQERDLL
ncbi:cation:proton antiporter [Caldithrix abyssi]